MGLFSFTQEIAMDLGTANTIIITNGKIVVDEPSVVALDRRTEKMIAVGEKAKLMHEKTHENIRTIRPLRDGVIADFYACEQMMRGLIKQVNTRNHLFSPSLRMVIGVPMIGKRRKPFKALRGVSFEIQTGMFGLLGPNGAGKSTLMRVICGIFEQSYGSIWINGLDTRIYREELQSLIGFLPQEFGTYENMTSWEFLDYQAILKGIVDGELRKERLDYVLKAVHMYERKDEKIGSFSGGMKQRIGIALILLHLPRILVVDEPTAGLDPRERIRFRNLLVELSKDRIVIFSTHIIEDISSSCNQVVVINKGELKYFGDPSDMVEMANGKVWQFNIDKTEFEKVLDKSLVIHHIQEGDTIRVRYLSVGQPYEGAVEVEANLEDAYLCLLKNMN